VQLSVESVSPAIAGAPAHSRRTAAVARLIAHHRFLPSAEKDLLYAACLHQHCGSALLKPESAARHLTDTFRGAMRVLDDDVPIAVRGVLDAWDVPGSGTALESKLAGMLRLAAAFDQEMEAQLADREAVGEILERLRRREKGGLSAEAIDALTEATRPASIGNPESWRVPVFPQAALRALKIMRNPEASLADLVDAVGLDPSIAGLTMQLANSALLGSRTKTSTLSQAIVRLGFITSKRVIMSAVMRPLFSSDRLQETWQHSIKVADLAEQLACLARTTEPAEAYLAGLVHDVGRMALFSIPPHDFSRLLGLVSDGCPSVYAESLLLRTDHAELGAQICASWRLPKDVISAIRQHHRPEKAESQLAHLLYLAEYLSGAEEDLPSVVRLEAALKGSGLTLVAVNKCTVSALGNWLLAK